MGAVTGSLARPEAVIAGRYRGKELEVVGRTLPLKDHQAAELLALLKPAGPTQPKQLPGSHDRDLVRPWKADRWTLEPPRVRGRMLKACDGAM